MPVSYQQKLDLLVCNEISWERDVHVFHTLACSFQSQLLLLLPHCANLFNQKKTPTNCALKVYSSHLCFNVQVMIKGHSTG